MPGCLVQPGFFVGLICGHLNRIMAINISLNASQKVISLILKILGMVIFHSHIRMALVRKSKPAANIQKKELEMANGSETLLNKMFMGLPPHK